jgi:HlyD family secretion protein
VRGGSPGLSARGTRIPIFGQGNRSTAGAKHRKPLTKRGFKRILLGKGFAPKKGITNMDIQRPSNARAKKIRRIAYGTIALILLVGVTYALSKLKPAAPSVDAGTVWSDTVKRGPMLREVRGLGTLVPVDIRWVAAQTDAHVDKWVLRPPAIVKPDSVIMELSDPTVQKDAVDAEYQLKGAEADYQNMKVQVNSDLMSQKSTEASVRSDYEQAKIQHDTDEKLVKEGLTSQLIEQQSRVKASQLAIRLQLEAERTKISTDSATARLAAQQAKVEQMKALYGLKKSQVDALHVRAGIDGVLQLLPVDVGQHVTPGMNLARVADPKKLRAEVKIAETQAKDVVPGQKASIDTRNGIVNGHVSRVDPSVINGTVTVDVTIDDPLPPGARPDLSVDGTITLENLKNVLYVGRPVHGQSDSTIGLFKLTEDGSEATRVNVKLGRSSVNTIEIVEGLKVGDKVILSDMSAWDNFDRIRLK